MKLDRSNDIFKITWGIVHYREIVCVFRFNIFNGNGTFCPNKCSLN